MQCIYLKKSNAEAEFTKREHVIPAGLGGLARLPLGYVSDEANEKFSASELIALRKSILAVSRESVGPGKRGTIDVKKVRSPAMRVLRDTSRNGEHFYLGFIFAGRSYTIPQLQLDFDDMQSSCQITFLSLAIGGKDEKQTLCDFRQGLVGFLRNRNRSYSLVDMPFETNAHFINIGYYRNRWFAATSHGAINMDFLAFTFLRELQAFDFAGRQYDAMDDLVQQYRYRVDPNIDEVCFLHAKTAFNALALFKGAEFVLDSRFDSMRRTILEPQRCAEMVEACLHPDLAVSAVISELPPRSHYVIITSVGNAIMAYVGFYREKFPAMITLTEEYYGGPFQDVLVCDWVNRREYVWIQPKPGRVASSGYPGNHGGTNLRID